MKRATTVAVIAVFAGLIFAPTASADKSRKCGDIDAYYIYQIQAFNISCREATSTAHLYARQGFNNFGQWKCGGRNDYTVCARRSGPDRQFVGFFAPD